jgi:hypothetical protein
VAGSQCGLVQPRSATLMLGVAAASFFVVLAAVAVAALRGVRHGRPGAAPAPSEAVLSRSVMGAVGLTVAMLISLLVASISTGRAVETQPLSAVTA